jgi:quercetin dioxygenase-like cupin family protein
MTGTFTYLDALFQPLALPSDGILSRTLVDNESLKLVIFQFAAGQVLSEHTAAVPAVIHILSGEATLTFGDEVREATPGAWAYMPAHLKHSVKARTDLVMALQMLKR